MKRPAIDTVLMTIARTWAQRASCPRAQVGAVLVTADNRIVATGYNGAPKGLPHCTDVGCRFDEGGHCIRSIHAEANAILQCARSGMPTVGLRLFTTHFPCPNCALLVIQAGIISVVYDVNYGSFNNVSQVMLYEAGVTTRRFKRESIRKILPKDS